MVNRYPSPWKEVGLKSGEAVGRKKSKRRKVVCNLPTVKDHTKLRTNSKVCPDCGGWGYTRSGESKRGIKQVKPCTNYRCPRKGGLNGGKDEVRV